LIRGRPRHVVDVMKKDLDDFGNYRLYRDIASKETDPEAKKCAEKAALYYSDASEGKAVGMNVKAAQYRSQARSWEKRYWHRFYEMGRTMREMIPEGMLKDNGG